jgi:diguanylate cyclase (GGDEF)-like protein
MWIIGLSAPALAAFAIPTGPPDLQAILWLGPLLPLVLGIRFRGGPGALAGIGLGALTLLAVHLLAGALGQALPPAASGLTLGYLGLAIGLNALARGWDRDRDTIEELAYTDLLTQVPNRRLLRRFLDTNFHDAVRGRDLAIVLFDVDNFKRFNDEHGHEAGDEALKMFAEVLRETTRRSCVSGRLGGEEFLSILPGSEVEGAAIFADRVRAAVQSREMAFGVITVSAGVAGFERGMKAPEELMAAADHALYQAKRDGRNCVRTYGRPILEDLLTVRSGDTAPAAGSGEEKDPAGPSEDSEPRGEPVTLAPHEIRRFGTGERVLIMEPDAAVRSLVSTYLAKEGLDVRGSADAEQAIRHLEEEHDLALISLGNASPNGIRLVAGIKARWPNTPVVAVADPDSPGLVTEALASGADRYLFKPFAMVDLGQSIDALLRLREARLQSWEARQWSSDFPEGIRAHLEQALEELVAAAEKREPGSEGRADRAAAMAAHLTRAVNAESPEADLDPDSVALAARMMGIGRTAVPEALLSREGPLGPDELAEVRMAPRRGAAMLESLSLPPVVVGAVRWHDIRWDGQGQSEVLGGRAIPIEARILGIVWALEAMTRNRPYEDAVPWDQAVEEVTTQMGHQFDPGLSEAFHHALPDLQVVASARTPGESEIQPREG